MKNKIFIGVFGIVVLFLFFNGSTDRYFKNYKKWMPKDFDTKTNVLLVENMEVYKNNGKGLGAFVKQDKLTKEYMKENYKYEYEFISAQDLDSIEEYNNTDKYRYFLSWSQGVNEVKILPGTTSTGQQKTIGGNSYITYTIYDRKLDTSFGTKQGTSYAIGVFSMYINTINKYIEGELAKPE